MHISLNNLGKKFNREWIFRNLSYEIPAGTRMVILGGNGSGKSTLLQVISGFVTPNLGDVIYKLNGKELVTENFMNHVSFASPYLQLVEDFTLTETISHVRRFKPFIKDLTIEEITELIRLKDRNKPVKQFSSGMKQRLKLALAILADTNVLLLDEPVSNLDREAINWYQDMIQNYGSQRTILVCSNAITEEYAFCTAQIDIAGYK